jgi:hypothetical protein
MRNRHFMPRLLRARQIICLSLFLALAAEAQWLPNGPPNVLEHEFITTGGITYFRLAGLLTGGYCCQRIAGYGVSRLGSDLEQVLQQEAWFDACVAWVCPDWREESVSVLGDLPPGRYSLTLLAGTPPAPWTTLPFTVPTNSSPTLDIATVTSTNGPQLLIHVAGVSNVVYALEFCTDGTMTNWIGIRTTLGAPATFSVTLTNGPGHFYRVAVRQAPPK